MGQFGFSQPVARREDPRLLTGRGRFVDDMAPADCLHAAMLRSPHGHARLARLDTGPALEMPGVRLVLTAADVAAAGIGPIPVIAQPKTRAGTGFVEHGQPLLADGVARFAGEGVAFVVADTEAQAREACEAIEADYEPLPAVVDCRRAAEPGAPPIWPDAPGNVAFLWNMGDAAAVGEAFGRAAHVARLDAVNNRVVLNAVETRGAIATHDAATGRYELLTGTQMPNPMKNQIVRLFGLEPGQVRVRVGDVGGGFGGKNSLFPEYALALLAAKATGRPVKWISDRSEAFVSDYHGRDNIYTGELALDAEGRFLALRIAAHAALGAYAAARGPVSPVNGYVVAQGGYRIPAIQADVAVTYTNTVPTDPYRGAGRPEVLYLVERLVDEAARVAGIARDELRRLNAIPRDAFPYAAPTGITYDDADVVAAMDSALARTGWQDFEKRRREARTRGRLRGIGMANYLERCGGGAGLSEWGELRIEADGTAVFAVGAMSNGQGHETAFSQLVNERLGLPFEKIRIVEGDTDVVRQGTGTGGSWSLTMGGGAFAATADRVIDKARRIAGHLLEAAIEDVEFADGTFRVAGTDLHADWAAVAAAAHDPARLPDGEAPGLEAEASFAPDNFTFPYGCHVAEVEVDPETGAVELLGYTAVHDFGRVLNPLLLAGQVHGGVVQGIGQALTEHTAYADDGQLLAGSWMDYQLPRAADLPPIGFTAVEFAPTTRNPFGIKGCGEAGAAGAPPAVMNAVVDALRPLGVTHLDMPATPARVWEAIRRAQGPGGTASPTP